MIIVLDGTWTPYYYPNIGLLLGLEILTVFIETALALMWNYAFIDETKQWSGLQVLGLIFSVNVVSFAFGLIFLISTGNLY